MPELPEVETIRRDLTDLFVGQTLTSVAVTGARSVRRHAGVEVFASGLAGRSLDGVDRRGKYLLLRFQGGRVVVIHLGMSGQLLATGCREPMVKHTHAVFEFGARELRFVDPRTFGELFVSEATVSGRTVPELAHLGLDPLADRPSLARLDRLLGARRCRLKPLLTDQRFLAGIGNIYGDEILFAARLHPARRSHTLSPGEVRALQRAIGRILDAAIAARGSSLADEQYRDVFGRPGAYQSRHRVYGREGQPCFRCRSTIARRKSAGRSTFWCLGCQW